MVINTSIINVEIEDPSMIEQEISSHYRPGGIVFETLIKDGFIDRNGKQLFHFMMQEARSLPTSDGRCTVRFSCYRVGD